MTSTPPANPAPGSGLPKRRRGESLRATRPTPPSAQAPGPRQPVTREQQLPADFAWQSHAGTAHPAAPGNAGATDRTAQPSPSTGFTWFASSTAHPATAPADPGTGRTTPPSQADLAWPTSATAAQPTTTDPAEGATGFTRRPAPAQFATPTTTTGGPGTAQPTRPTDPATGRTPQTDLAWPARTTTAGGPGTVLPTAPADPATGRTAPPSQADLAWPTSATAAQPTTTNPAEGATGFTRRPAPAESATPTTTTGGPGAGQSSADSARLGRPEAAAAAALTLPPPTPQPKKRGRAARVPAWRRVANAVLGVALLAAAVALQTAVLHEDDRDAPITSSGTAGEMVDTAFFGARVESVEVARALQEENRERVDPSPGQLFVVVKVRATGKTRALQLKSARLVTADGLKYEATERVLPTRTLAHKWVQPMLWSSGLVFFEVPPEALPGASVVVAENQHPLFGDQYMIEASIDLGLDEAKARAAVDSATSVYRIPKS